MMRSNLPDGQEIVAEIGQHKFIRLTDNMWVEVQCDGYRQDIWVIKSSTQYGYVMFQIKKCGSIILIRQLEGDEIEVLEALDRKLI